MSLTFLALRRTLVLGVGTGCLLYNTTASAAKLIMSNCSSPQPFISQPQQLKRTSYLSTRFEGSMSMAGVQSELHLPDEALGQLQGTILRAVFSRQRLPGSQQPIQFPDLSFILRQSTIFLVNENLAESFSFTDSLKPVRILSSEALRREAQLQGDIAYLRFQTPQVENNVVRLTLEAKIASSDTNQQPLGLSGMQVRFQEVACQWKAVEEPIFFAN